MKQGIINLYSESVFVLLATLLLHAPPPAPTVFETKRPKENKADKRKRGEDLFNETDRESARERRKNATAIVFFFN